MLPTISSQENLPEDSPSDEDDISAPPLELSPVEDSPTKPLYLSSLPSLTDDTSNEQNAPARAFAKILTQALGDVVALAIAATRLTATADAAKYPRAKNPAPFSGRRRRYLRTWICENEICFRTAPNLYQSDTLKIMFAASFLEGDAKSWFTNYFRHPASLPAFMSKWDLFVAELQLNFGLEDELGVAEEDMRRLTMADSDHASYFAAQFRAIRSRFCGAWSDRTLRNQYYLKLAPRLRSIFISAGTPVPTTLAPLMALASRFDRAHWANDELNRSIALEAAKVESDSSGSLLPTKLIATLITSPTTSVLPLPTMADTSILAAHLTKGGKLTLEEKQRRIDAGACFYCGEVGHLTAQCPKKVRSHTTNASAPAAPRVAANRHESDNSGKD
jgi:hypothetical protein